MLINMYRERRGKSRIVKTDISNIGWIVIWTDKKLRRAFLKRMDEVIDKLEKNGIVIKID